MGIIRFFKKWHIVFLLILINSVVPFSFAKDMRAEIARDYKEVYQAKFYNFFGGQLHAVSVTNGYSIKNLEQNNSDSISTELLRQSISTLQNITSIDCLTSRLALCLIVHGGNDGLFQNISVFANRSQKFSRTDLPVKVMAKRSFAAKTDDGWVISSFSTGKIFKIDRKGHFSELPDLSFNAEQDFLEIHQAWNGMLPVAVGILVQKNTLLGQRLEKQWSVIGEKSGNYTIDAEKDCSYLGYSKGVFACAWYDAKDNSNIRFGRIHNGDTFVETENYALGQVTLTGSAQNYMGGLLFNIAKNGHFTLYYLPIEKNKQHYAVKLNSALERLRGGVDLTFQGFSSVGNRLLLMKQSSIHPYALLLVSPGKQLGQDASEKPALGEVKLIDTGVKFFNPEKIEVTHFVSKGRQVPYTVISQPGIHGKAQGKAILTAYASFGTLLREKYLAEFGKFWIQEGGVYVYVHARGGGGFGKRWDESGYGTNKIEAVYDLENVAEELIERGYARKGQVNLQAESAGGIVTAAAALRRPDIFSKIALTSPCLGLWDNARGYCTESNEYGNPLIPGEMAKMRNYSPIHLLWSAQKIIPFLIVQSSYDPIVPPVVTDKFLSMKKDISFARIIQIEGTVHGENFSYQDGAYISAERLTFFLGK